MNPSPLFERFQAVPHRPPNRGSMKKGIIVLLITVLAAGMAFATFTGSASINFGVSLDEKGWGFTNKKAFDEYSFTFGIDTQSASVGAEHQTDIWAELEAEASVSVLKEKDDAAPYFDMDMDITVANIHVYDFTIGILGPKAAYDYASSWTNDRDTVYHSPNHNYANNAKGGFKHSAGGFNVSYQGYTLSFAMNNAYTAEKKGSAAGYGSLVYFSQAYVDGLNEPGKEKEKEAFGKKYVEVVKVEDEGVVKGAYYADRVAVVKDTPASEKLTVFASAETKAFELAEGMTVQAAANMILVGKDSKPVMGAAAKYAYAADKLSVNFAADFQFDANKEVVALDAKADAKYDIVNGAVYFGSDKLGKDGAEYVLEAKVGADIPVAENVVIKVTGEVDDLYLNKKAEAFKSAAYKASVGTTVDKLTVKANMAFGAKVVDKNNTTKATVDGLLVGANVEYAAEVFKAKAGISVGFEKKADALAYYGVKPSASIETSAIVEKCTLSLGWSGANFVAEDATDIATASKGSINAAAKISF